MAKFDESTITRVWEQARAIPDYDPGEWRQDECGAWIHRSQYGRSDDEFGWKIEYTRPGLEEPRAFHVGNEFDVSMGQHQCRVTADRRDISSTEHVEQPRNESATGGG